MNKYYPAQMNGPVISAFAEAQEAEKQKTSAIYDYLHSLSIDSAEETELENIGRLIGFLRPIVPEGFADENFFVFGNLPLQQDFTRGFSSEGRMSGGQFISLEQLYGLGTENYMSLGTYREFLKRMAYIKRYGVTLSCIDAIASLFGYEYTIEWNEDKDIVITYAGEIGYKNIWILTQLFYRVCTEPQVLIFSE